MTYATTSTATDYTGKGITSSSNDNAERGLSEAKSLRQNLGKVQEYFDNRLLGSLNNFQFSFDPYVYDIINSSLSNSGMSKLSAEILSYEVLALSKWYSVPYDEILPIIKDSKLQLTAEQLTRLNKTRPVTNAINIINSNISNDILKEQVD